MKPTAATVLPATRQPVGQSPGRDRGAPYRLVVLGSETADAVSGAGGLIVDAVRAGWRVAMYLEIAPEPRALRILGVEDGQLLATDVGFGPGEADAVVFAADIYHRHRGVRRCLADAVRRGAPDVAAWGGPWSAAPASASDIDHRLSPAARAFKSHAMQAVGAPPPAGAAERFYGGLHRLIATSPPPE